MQWSYKLQLLYHPTCNTCIATEQKPRQKYFQRQQTKIQIAKTYRTEVYFNKQEPTANKQGSCVKNKKGSYPFPKGVTSAHQHKIQNNPPAAQWQDA
jgi:hypothetical protein